VEWLGNRSKRAGDLSLVAVRERVESGVRLSPATVETTIVEISVEGWHRAGQNCRPNPKDNQVKGMLSHNPPSSLCCTGEAVAVAALSNENSPGR
ncbi:hypothetical protein CEXT_718441, partial [Caerostris extrusa]